MFFRYLINTLEQVDIFSRDKFNTNPTELFDIQKEVIKYDFKFYLYIFLFICIYKIYFFETNIHLSMFIFKLIYYTYS